MSKILSTPKTNENTVISKLKGLFISLSYFYIVSRQEETRFTRFKKTKKKGLIMLNIKDQNYFKRSIKIFIIAIFFFLISFILSIIFSPSLKTFKNMTNQAPSNLDNVQGLHKLWNYILNNAIKVPFQMFIFSLIPIPFLYFLNMISTSIITGIAFGFAIHFDFNKGSIMVISSIPHTVIEILAMCFVISGLYKLNQAIIRKISNLFRKTKKQNLSFKLALSNLLKIYFLIALPLYIIAAFLETYLTDFIYNLFT